MAHLSAISACLQRLTLRVPHDLAPGVRHITIRAIDEYGQEHERGKVDRGDAVA